MNKIVFNLPETFAYNLFKLNQIDCYLYDTLTSTNDQAWLLEKQNNIPFPFVVIARQQTAGKGQRGHIWRSHLGGLYLSLGLELNLPVDCLHHLTLFSASAIASEFNNIKIPVAIKWLNDLILEGRKLGGILWETKIEKSIIKKAVIGIGINYQNNSPANGISLNDYLCVGQNPDIDSIEKIGFLAIKAIINGYYFYKNYGIDFVVKTYNSLLYNHKETALINQQKGEILGVNKNAHLLIKISSQNAKTIIKFPPEKYSISYNKNSQGYFVLEEK
ncbi:biotin--[acetyl-CoA-carboxylase] ligase [Cyanobacterium aponinum UTEX 3222]|uniref:Biotin--[acetyl-CoA-carboxylase] ligase n=1 Tax=Cyanobacterium aponinum 0216 TaxID=2676140 RepID=A0A844GZV6_9CHRO|nr:biotin--[acetyl-CoA-carboxylase] ligase [Cyanobacterium aponinum]MTF40518.1 biotin--[acetyl-CoA-carboxylase] ligase [Cyanobacterium aponinum 0216]PHV61411.1 biotin--[acetyl-CoA-carboxylase] ligase [Cyanobacterium aponinum IPPAS B-1201]WRL38635.1 biotin--[acetyl-CoA-carboxylase] ligase [Cyanobacterium aponinum UTEX 3221]WRL41076.1 biotin--[acetyl-CoA-carboxylase] ligase [Cyanobacterium aponinum UTEX 3222]